MCEVLKKGFLNSKRERGKNKKGKAEESGDSGRYLSNWSLLIIVSCCDYLHTFTEYSRAISLVLVLSQKTTKHWCETVYLKARCLNYAYALSLIGRFRISIFLLQQLSIFFSFATTAVIVHVLITCHMNTQLHRGMGKAVLKSSQCIWETQQNTQEPVFQG